MSGRVTEDRIRELARDLAPVKPIPRLRVVGAVVLVTWALAFVADELLGGRALRPAADPAWASPSYLAALLGIALAALGATGAALASAVPGREGTARIGLRVTALGLALALAGWILGVSGGAGDHAGESAGAVLSCAGRALALGVVPALLACGFAARAALRRPVLAAGMALAGGVALGAVAVHASCPSNSPLHQLVAHTLAPVAAAALFTAPLAALLSHWGRRARAS